MIELTLKLVTIVAEQGSKTVKVKLEGSRSVGEVPYVMRLIVTAVT